MATQFSTGKYAIAECDVCGFRYKLSELKETIVNKRNTGIKACPTCWDEDHPQLRTGELRVIDPQAVRDPRPDFRGYSTSRARTQPVSGIVLTVSVGTVTASAS